MRKTVSIVLGIAVISYVFYIQYGNNAQRIKGVVDDIGMSTIGGLQNYQYIVYCDGSSCISGFSPGISGFYSQQEIADISQEVLTQCTNTLENLGVETPLGIYTFVIDVGCKDESEVTFGIIDALKQFDLLEVVERLDYTFPLEPFSAVYFQKPARWLIPCKVNPTHVMQIQKSSLMYGDTFEAFVKYKKTQIKVDKGR